MEGAYDFHTSSNISWRFEFAESFKARRDYFREVSVKGKGADLLGEGAEGGRVDRSS